MTAIQTGTRLGPYEIVSRVGAGGMGEVFRARDTRLDRTVAVKTLPTELAKNAQLRLRLQREAKAISGLSHPNICALYDIGEHEGIDYLVMEYLEGETLADRIGRGALPLKEALRIGVDVASALERAHREGVVHRDLKPGNVMLTRTGAKLLDFGLAKTAAGQSISADAPTMQHADAPLTAEGTIVGTFQYMAPEQIEGSDIDARTDIFALGALLYEMVTGKRAFGGKNKTSLIASIVASAPRPMAEIAPVTPPELEHVVQRCLEKEPDARWQSAHDVRLELEWIAKRADVAGTGPRRRVPAWAWGTAAVLAVLAAAAIAAMTLRSLDRTEPLALHTHVLAPKGKDFGALMDTLSVSPDGRYVTFAVANDRRLWVRPLNSTEARPIDGTEGAMFPFWSPDGRWIAFFDYQKLKKVNLSGAPPVAICDAPRGRSGTWNRDDVILFSPTATSGIFRVPAAGGKAEPLTKLDAARKETTHRWPAFLPDGNRFLYFAGTHQETIGGETHSIYLSSLDKPGERKLLTRARSNALVVQEHLIYVRDQLLVAQPFDLRGGAVRGEPFRIAGGIEYDAEFFRATFAATDEGMLIYRTLVSPPDGRLHWYSGEKFGEPLTEAQPFKHFRLSPDRKRVAAAVFDRATGLTDLWLLDLETNRQTRLTSTPGHGEEAPVWTHDGRQIIFSRHAGFATGGDIYAIPADGNGSEKLLHHSERETLPFSSSKDGLIAFTDVDDTGGERRSDIATLSLTQGSKPRPFLNGPHNEDFPSFSPDGRWIAYISDEAGQSHAYVTSFPGRASRVQISSRPAFTTGWAGNGIVIATPDAVFHVEVRIEGDRLTVGSERSIATISPNILTGDIASADRVLVARRAADAYDDTITVTTDWLPESR